jgi:hypothetical protein
VSKGYGRDHRDDLNQMVLELITESRANLPMMMRLLSGNASDRTSFKDAIERHVGKLRGDDGSPSMVVVTDSAGFTRDCLAACQRQGLGWVMSVPSTVGEARRRLEDVDPETLRPLMAGQLTVPGDEGFRGELAPRVVSGCHRFLGEGVEVPPYLRKRNGVGEAAGYVLHELFLAGALRAGAAVEPDELLEVFDDEGVQNRAELHASPPSSARAVSRAEREMAS